MNFTSLKKFRLRKLFSSEDSRFILFTAIKIAGVYVIAMAMVGYLMWLLLSMNNVFFEANGFPELSEFRAAFFDYILTNLLENLTYILSFYIILFLAGIYTGRLLIRPFDSIADYSLEAIENKNASYDPSSFSDFKLLTRFSDFFFQYIYDSRRKNEFIPNTIPPTFSKIHKPVFDKVFFFHFILIVIILAIVTATYVSVIIFEMYDQIINLAFQAIPISNSTVAYFLKNQEYVFHSVRDFAVIAIVICYLALGIHLYTRVAGAVFAFFATMRAFIKGNTSARVHLLEHRHLRPQARALNKFLDQICREMETSNNKNKDS